MPKNTIPQIISEEARVMAKRVYHECAELSAVLINSDQCRGLTLEQVEDLFTKELRKCLS